MKTLFSILALGAAVLIAASSPALAAFDASATASKVEAVFKDLHDNTDAMTALINSVNEKIAAGAKADQFYEDLGKLIAYKNKITAYRADLTILSKAIDKYKADNPGLPPDELKKLSAIQDRVEVTSMLIDNLSNPINIIVAKVTKSRPKKAESGQSVWHVSGEIGLLTGKTDSKENQQYLALREVLKNRKGQEFAFYQRYDDNHSFIDQHISAFGAVQKFPTVNQGRIDVTEQYYVVKDLTNAFNSRKELSVNFNWEQPWANGRNQLITKLYHLDKSYDAPSPFSYGQSQGYVKFNRRLSSRTSAEAYWEGRDYTYDAPHTYSYKQNRFGLGFDTIASRRLTWGADAYALNKTYDVSTSLGYTERNLILNGRYEFAPQEFIEGRTMFLRNDRKILTGFGYNEQDYYARYYKSFNPKVEGQFRANYRNKDFHFTSPYSYSHWLLSSGFSFYPTTRFRWYFDEQYDTYDFTDNLRNFWSSASRVGGSWTLKDDATFSSELNFLNQGYPNSTPLGFYRAEWTNDYYKYIGRATLRLYFALDTLNQKMTLSPNDYDTLHAGTEVGFRISKIYRFIVSYDYLRRNYKNQPDEKDSSVFARLAFNF